VPGASAKSDGARRNLELKARLRSRDAALKSCEGLGGADHGVLRQRDTYFAAAHGRLKLREEDGRAELIAYHRPDIAAERESSFHRVAVADPAALAAALAATLGIVAVVGKERRLFIWQGVRIHLDRVAGLGDFVEFEAPLGAGSPIGSARSLLAVLASRLGIREEDRVAVGYVDLIRRASPEDPGPAAAGPSA
jgi:predicted adenylyl cyclase CyaB